MSQPKLKVLFVLTPALDPNSGGVQMSTWKIGSWLASRGHEVAAFSFASEGHAAVSAIRLLHPEPSTGGELYGGLGSLVEVLQQFEPDVVINQMPYEHDIGEVLKENKAYLLLGCLRNTLYSVRGNLESYVARVAPGPLKRFSSVGFVQGAFLAMHRRRHRVDLLKILQTYDHFVMFGPPNLEELRYFVPGFVEEGVRLIPNSIREVAETVPEKEKRLLYLGRLAHEQKRSELILPIWERVSQLLPGWELDVVGDGPQREELQGEAERRALPRIHFHGRQVPDDYYRRASIFFMTSAFEGFPNTLVEAQSFGAIPVVFDSYPVASWLVEDQVNGYLIPPLDIDQMAERIVELAKNPQKTGMAEAALESARRFHVDRVGQLWQDLFDAEVPKHSRRFASKVPAESA